MVLNGIDSSNRNFIRFGGLATGLDTDNIIQQMLNVDKIPLTRTIQQRTLLEWRRDDYREITNSLRSFRDEFMDVLKPASNMLSDAIYKKFNVTSSDTSVVTATASSSAVAGSHNIDSISALATAANTTSTAAVTQDLAGTVAAELDYTGANQFQMTVDGLTKTINLRDGAYFDATDLVSNGSDGIQDMVNSAFGAGKVTVSEAGGIITFSAANTKITLANGTNDALSLLKFSTGASNRLNVSDTLEDLTLTTGLVFDGGTDLNIKINDVDFVFAKTTTLSSFMSEINNSSAGVTISYNEINDKFTITAEQKGAGDTLNIDNNGISNFFGAASNLTAGIHNNGTDAEFVLDGVSVKRNDNTFTVEGIQYKLKSLYNTIADPDPTDITVTADRDVDGIYDNIKTFIDKYNEVISGINSKISQKYNRNYLPLTAEQKESMSEDDIKQWEEKAKTGLLRSDSMLRNIVDRMRLGMYDAISGVTGVITEIGIETSENYTDKGKLIIDETKLKDAINDSPDKVLNLFNKTSSISYSATLSAADKTTRYNEEGFVQRLYDVIQDNIRTSRNSNGKKGILIEKAGMIGDLSEFSNTLYQEIDGKSGAISDLEAVLYKKQERYYKAFTALEKAVSQMNSQGSWLSQQFSNN